jgi:molybdate transport system substrate-binding protein
VLPVHYRRFLLVLVAVASALALTGCGFGRAGQQTGTDGRVALRIFGASSLTQVLPVIDPQATYSFAGSDTLAEQIRQGAPADVLAAASTRQPGELADEGLCEDPTPFATNSLVLIVPRDGAAVASIDDLLTGPRRRLAIGTAQVPIGAYARTLLANLDALAALDRNIVSAEQDAASIIAKVALGSADAGIAYATDARASDAVTAIALPAAAEPTVVYAACVVRREGADSEGARAFIAELLAPAGPRALTAAGFGKAP